MNHRPPLAPQPDGLRDPNRVIARNFLALSSSRLAGQIVGLVTSIYTRRVLEAVAIGQFSWCSSVLSYFSLVSNPGLETVAKRDVARNPSRAAGIFSLLLTLQLTFAASAFVLVTAFAASGWQAPAISRLMGLLAIGLLFLPFNLTWLLEGLQRMGPAAVGQTVIQVLQVPVLIWLVREPAHILRYAVLAYPFQLALTAYLFWYATRHRLLQWSEVHLTFRGGGRLLREALPLGLSQAAILLYYNVDLVMLGVWADDRAVGLYGTAYQLMLKPLFMAMSLYNACFPRLAQAFSDPRQAGTCSNELLRGLIWMGFPLAALGWVFGRNAIVLLYGADFAGGGPLLEWLSLNIALVFLNIGMGSPLLAWGRQGTHLRITTAAALLNVGLNLVLIPRYGAWGAVITTILSELLAAGLCVRVRRHNVPVVIDASGRRAVGITLGLAIILKLLAVSFPHWWWASLALGVIAFAACIWWHEKENLLRLAGVGAGR